MAASALYRNGAKLRRRQRLLPPAGGQRRLNWSQGRHLVCKDQEEAKASRRLSISFLLSFWSATGPTGNFGLLPLRALAINMQAFLIFP